jgi:hypothetical protein
MDDARLQHDEEAEQYGHERTKQGALTTAREPAEQPDAVATCPLRPALRISA